MDPDGRKTMKVTDEQWGQISQAKENVSKNLENLITYLKTSNNDIDKVDSKIIKSAQTYLSSEFGSAPFDCDELASRLESIKFEIDNLGRDDFLYNDSYEDKYATTMPIGSKKIVLGDLFFSSRMNGSFDSKEGTLLHEATHHLSVFGTFDLSYKDETMVKLPDWGIFSKSNNANNWEYFYEEIY